jgi:uncharacterized protein (DUF58 family)
VLLSVALYKGVNLLLLLACSMLAAWGINWYWARRPLRKLRVRRRTEGPPFAGTPLRVELEVTNTGRAPAVGVCLEEDGSAHRLAWSVPELAREATVWLRQTVVLPQRGRYAWGPLGAVSGYPFGLVRRTAQAAPGEEVIVLPRIGQVHRGRLRRFLAAAGLAYALARPRPSPTHARAQAEFHGLRAFRSGDSPRWIHWRTSARCAEVMVREFEDIPSDDLIVVLDLFEGGTGNGDGGTQPHAALEEALSLAATVCWEWSRQKGDELVLAAAGREVVVRQGTTGRAHALSLLELLAVQEPPGEPTWPALVEQLAALHLPAAPLLVISLAPSDLGDLLALRLRRPAAAVAVSALNRIDFYEPPCG